MRMGLYSTLAVGLIAAGCVSVAKEDGFVSIFDGKTLDGWEGKEALWSVKDGVINGQTTKEKPTRGNTFLIYRKAAVANFELKWEYRFVSAKGNSGIQYRSEELDNFVVKGYQADFEAGTTYSGILYGEKTGRGIMCSRGKKAWLGDGKTRVKPDETVADSGELQKGIKGTGEWNTYHVIADGNHFTHKINGVVMSETFDESKKDMKASGILALQLHAGPPMQIQFRKIMLKTLK